SLFSTRPPSPPSPLSFPTRRFFRSHPSLKARLGKLIVEGLLHTARLVNRLIAIEVRHLLPYGGRQSRRIRARFHRQPICRGPNRSEEHTSELQSRGHLVCRLLLEKK